jgi:hypothetical protein
MSKMLENSNSGTQRTRRNIMKIGAILVPAILTRITRLLLIIPITMIRVITLIILIMVTRSWEAAPIVS